MNILPCIFSLLFIGKIIPKSFFCSLWKSSKCSVVRQGIFVGENMVIAAALECQVGRFWKEKPMGRFDVPSFFCGTTDL